MPLPYHLIDGYNLLHAAGLARATYGPGDLERARTALLVRLADGLDDTERERTTVVFDAADPPPDASPSFRFRGMAVLFAVEHGEADALIEDLIRKHAAPRQLRVVSEDIRIQKAAKRRGAQAVKSEAFLQRLKRRAAPQGPRERKQVAPAQDEGAVGDWLDFFGIDGAEIAVGDLTPKPDVAQEPASVRKPGPKGAQPAPGAAARAAPAPSKESDGREPRPDVRPDAEPEDSSFWQRRIDELVRDESRRRESG